MGVVGTLLRNRRAGEANLAWNRPGLSGPQTLEVTSEAFADGRCVMTTLPQFDLPKDSGILRTAAQHNNAAVGVYADVVRGGKIRRGDRLTVL